MYLRDLLRRVLGDLLNLHAARRGGDDDGRLGRAVHRHAQIEFLRDVDGLLYEHCVDGHTLRAGLRGDEVRPEQPRGEFRRLIRTRNDLDAARLAAPARMNLRLDDGPAAKLLRDGPRLIGARCDAAIGNGDAEGFQYLFGLVFVNLHPIWLLIPQVVV